MRNRKNTAIEKQKANIEENAKQRKTSALELAKQEYNKCNRVFTLVSIIGPILNSLLYVLFDVDFSALIWRHLIINIFSTVMLVLALSVLSSKLEIAQCVVAKIELSKEHSQNQIKQLEQKIQALKDNEIFYISATELLGTTMLSGKRDLESLSKAVVGAIYHNLSKITNGDNITINLYEFRNNRAKMLLSTTRLKYCERSSINIPILYSAKDGMSIVDSRIQDYYCIKCIRGKVKSKNGKYVLSDWKDLVREFRWDGWPENEKEQILKTGDRQRCIELGFKYNQYFSFMINRDDGTVGYFEIIANEDTCIASSPEISQITHRLRETYSPLLSILWDISDPSAERS